MVFACIPAIEDIVSLHHRVLQLSGCQTYSKEGLQGVRTHGVCGRHNVTAGKVISE